MANSIRAVNTLRCTSGVRGENLIVRALLISAEGGLESVDIIGTLGAAPRTGMALLLRGSGGLCR